MSRNFSIFNVLVMMAVTVMATAAVAFAIPNEGGNGQPKVTICHKGHTITVAQPAVDAHIDNHGDTMGSCLEGPVPEPPDGITLTTQATELVTLGQPISDMATLSGATSDATGTITFSVYGPFTDADLTTDVCDETTLADELDPVDIGSPENGNYVVFSDDPAVTTDGFVPSAVGRYQWIASYSGDDANDPVTSECNAEGEQSVVEEESTTTLELTTNATPSVTLGQPISDTATLSGGDNPTGTITFNVYGPDDEDCSGEPAFTSEVDVDNGEGDYPSEPFTPTAVGTYRWTAEYSGDDANDPVTSECNAEGEQSVVEEESTTTIATEQLTTLALDHKKQRLLAIKEKLRDDETPREQKEVLRERRKQLREELYG